MWRTACGCLQAATALGGSGTAKWASGCCKCGASLGSPVLPMNPKEEDIDAKVAALGRYPRAWSRSHVRSRAHEPRCSRTVDAAGAREQRRRQRHARSLPALPSLPQPLRAALVGRLPQTREILPSLLTAGRVGPWRLAGGACRPLLVSAPCFLLAKLRNSQNCATCKIEILVPKPRGGRHARDQYRTQEHSRRGHRSSLSLGPRVARPWDHGRGFRGTR